MRLAVSFDDGLVFAVTARPPAIYTAVMTGFSPREHDADRSWQWMGAGAAWTIVNTTAGPIAATLDLELSAFAHPRLVELRLDGRPVQTLLVEPARRVYQIGPVTVLPGNHEILFHPTDPPTVASAVISDPSADTRPLSLAFGTWSWAARSNRP